jgi:hypothetical protein
MKKLIIAASLLATMISSVSFADELCGLLQKGSDQAGAVTFLTIFTITSNDGNDVSIATDDANVLQSFVSLTGSNVCAEGTLVEQGFQVTSISAQ